VLSSRATSGLSPPVLPDPSLEKLVLGHLAAAAREALHALADVPLTFTASEGRADASDGSASDQFSGNNFHRQSSKACSCPMCKHFWFYMFNR
jgi:hypothetical protein